MLNRPENRIFFLCLVSAFIVLDAAAGTAGASWNGTLTDGEGKPIAGSVITLHAPSNNRIYTATTAIDGRFAIADIVPGIYEVSAKIAEREWTSTLVVKDASPLTMSLQIPSGQELRILPSITEIASAQATGGEH